MAGTTTIDLMRHGEPVGGRKYRGQTDDPLSANGWQEMWAAVEGDAPWERIVTSPLRRCSEFAYELATRLRLPVGEDPRFKEVGFGTWEGKTGAELKRLDPLVLSRFYHDPVNHRPPGAEHLGTFRNRVEAAFLDALQENRGRHLLVITHAGVIRAVMASILRSPPETMYCISVPTATLTRVFADEERPPTLAFSGRRRVL